LPVRLDTARQEAADSVFTRLFSLADVPVLPGDESLDSYLRRIGFSDAEMYFVQRSYANATGDAPEYISAMAALEDIVIFQGDDFRILDGYDCLASGLAEGLDMRLNTVVEVVDWSGESVRVRTTDGQVYEADDAIITLPLGVLQAGSVRFTPELPADKQAAIKHLRMGPVIKLIFRFDPPALPEDSFAFRSALNPPIWWVPTFEQSSERGQVVTGFASGNWARELLALGEDGALARGLEGLRTELGRPDLQAAEAHLVNWPDDPFARGGYSVAPPGHADAREILARPVSKHLYFAGEATAPNDMAATVHGAYVTGKRAASEVLLNHRVTEDTELKVVGLSPFTLCEYGGLAVQFSG
jgi:monoamine oxidase